MSYQTLLYQRRSHTGTITLNRPEAANAVDVRLAQELADLCARIDGDDAVRAVVITGAGRVFSSGIDRETLAWSAAGPLSRLRCPVIAAVNGDALGQGLELALACDIRVASATARFGLGHIAAGVIPWDGGTQRLARLVGRARSLEMLLLGETVTAREACRIGLVNRVVPAGELAAAAAEMARRIAAGAPVAVRYAREAVDKGLDLTLEQGLRLETDLYLLLQTTQDRVEGITAFREKRRPKFTGK